MHEAEEQEETEQRQDLKVVLSFKLQNAWYLPKFFKCNGRLTDQNNRIFNTEA